MKRHSGKCLLSLFNPNSSFCIFLPLLRIVHEIYSYYIWSIFANLDESISIWFQEPVFVLFTLALHFSSHHRAEKKELIFVQGTRTMFGFLSKKSNAMFEMNHNVAIRFSYRSVIQLFKCFVETSIVNVHTNKQLTQWFSMGQ